MKPDRWREIERLRQQALEREPSRRAQFLEQACGGDRDLWREVESLLAQQSDAKSPLDGRTAEPVTVEAVSQEVPASPGRAALSGEAPLPMDAGRYTLLEQIGAGGMGKVYRALDRRLDREVAVKFLPEWMVDDPLALHRFRQEAHAAASLNHPNILAVTDWAVIDGAPCLVSELLTGRTLREAMVGRSIPLPEAIDYALQIIAGLSAAHEKGIIHRDLKPDNLFLTRDGRMKILDFGLAKHLPTPADKTLETTLTTSAGTVVGTRGYQSPEQVRGERLDARSDLFAFGAVLYELLTGRRAFQRQTAAETTAAVLDADLPPPSAVDPAVPLSCDAIVSKALEKDRQLRYQSAAEISVDLRRVHRELAGGSSASDPSHGVAVEDRRPKSTIVIATLGAAVTILVLVVVVSVLVWPGSRGVSAGAAWQLTSAAGWTGDPSVSPDGTQVAYSADEGDSRHIWISDVRSNAALQLTHGDADDAYPCWTADGTAVLFSSDRDGGGIFAVSRFGGEPRLIVPDAAEPAVSPDGARIAFVRHVPGSAGTRIFIASLNDPGNARQLTSDRDGLWDHHRPAWSSDGRSVVYRAQMAIWRADVDGSGSTRLTRESQHCDRPVSAPDGSIYYGSNLAGSYALWRLPSRGSAARVTPGTGERDPSLSADGRVLAYAISTVDYNLVLHDLRSGREEHYGGVRKEYLPSLAPDGDRVFFVANLDSTGDQLWAVEIADGEFSGAARRITGPPGQVSRATCSPNGKWLVYYRVIGDQRDVWVVAVTGGPPTQVTHDPAPDIQPAWAPDGVHIAFVSERGGHSHVWTVPVRNGVPAGPASQLTTGPTEDQAPAWSPDGNQVAYIGGAADGSSEVWLAPSDGKGPLRKVTSGAQAERVQWEPGSGKLLVSAWWSTSRLSLRRVDPETGASEALSPPLVFGRNPSLIDFDVLRDGHALVFSRDDSKSNIWVLHLEGGGR
jgi:Tol biopolymer transport system component